MRIGSILFYDNLEAFLLISIFINTPCKTILWKDLKLSFATERRFFNQNPRIIEKIMHFCRSKIYMCMNKHLLAALIAFIIWGFFSLPLKPLENYDSMTILLFRVVFSVVFLGAYLVSKPMYITEVKNDWKELPLVSQRKQKFYLVLTGVLLGLNWLSFIYTMNHISVRATSMAYLVCPILTAFLAVFLLKEHLRRNQWMSLLISAIACTLLAYEAPKDVVAALFVGLTYALYLVFQKKIFIKRPTPLLLIQLLVALPAILVYLFLQDKKFVFPTELMFYALLLLISLLFTLVPLLLNIYALKGAPSSSVGMLLNINPLMAFLLSVFYWNERLDGLEVLAYSLIFIAVLLFNQHMLVRSKKLIA